MNELSTEKIESDLQPLISAVTRIHEDTCSRLVSGNFSYDAYIETVCSQFSDIDTETLVRFIPIDNYNDSLPFDRSRDHAAHIIQTVESIRPGASVLLLDPLIALRSDQFIGFLKKDTAEDVVQVRNNFIRTFPVETYYRGIVLHPWTTPTPQDHFARTVKHALSNVDAFAQRGIEQIQKAARQTLADGNVERIRGALPFLSAFEDSMWRHINNRQTGYDFISVSKYPQVVWHIVSGNEEKEWKNILHLFTVRISRFQVNSFYALPLSDFLTSLKTSTEPLVVEEGGVRYEYPFKDDGIEYLVPFSLPEDFMGDPRDFSPVYEDDIPISFYIPTPEDW